MENRYQCQICQITLETADSLKEHVRVHEHEIPLIGRSVRLPNTRGILIQPSTSDSGWMPCRCEMCNKRFAIMYNKRFAMMSNLVDNTWEKYAQRELSKKGFVGESTFKDRLQTPTRKKIFKCHICNLTSISEHDLNLHLLTHTSGYKCGVCQEKFTEMELYNEHLRAHATISVSDSMEIDGESFKEESILKHLLLM
ncbi:hypothetical protein TNCT_354171 [Trichonephila clavata]|uniref:C2H2-type domain-containing protein n=1 Tax=Trichonephila clavata TaxID=2740835 RepID=A0A8X6G7G5_TRICU|nr:hypothetical protein TNCT_354171 [Trichonephila clavata]